MELNILDVRDERFDIPKGMRLEIRLVPETQITDSTRRLIYAMLSDISKFAGSTLEETKETLKRGFMLLRTVPHFSLSDVDQEIAGRFAEYIYEIACEYSVSFKKETFVMTKEMYNYALLSLKWRSCQVCSKKADVHHVDMIGRGVKRSSVNHQKHRLMALCREHHGEIHNIGEFEMAKKYGTKALKVNEEQIKMIKYR
jgi:hypothetical protein